MSKGKHKERQYSPKFAKQRQALFDRGIAVHATEEEMEKTLEVVTHYYDRGYTQLQIVDRLIEERSIKVTSMTVSGYIRKLRKRWQEGVKVEREQYVAQKLRQLDDLKREAWTAYHGSRSGERTVTKEYAVPTRLKDASSKMDAGEDGGRTDPGAPKQLKLLRKQIKEMGRLPANQFLQTVLQCLAMEVDLLGLAAPKEAKLTLGGGDGKTVLDWTVHANALPPARNIEEELKAIRDEMNVIDAEVVSVDPSPQEPKKGKPK